MSFLLKPLNSGPDEKMYILREAEDIFQFSLVLIQETIDMTASNDISSSLSVLPTLVSTRQCPIAQKETSFLQNKNDFLSY